MRKYNMGVVTLLSARGARARTGRIDIADAARTGQVSRGTNIAGSAPGPMNFIQVQEMSKGAVARTS